MASQKAYRIKRGTLNRREPGKFRAVRYDRGSVVYLTDDEAAKYGLHRLERLEGLDKEAVKTEAKPAKADTPPRPELRQEVDTDLVHGLLADKDAMQPADFRKAVKQAGVLETVPRAHVEIVEALEELVRAPAPAEE